MDAMIRVWQAAIGPDGDPNSRTAAQMALRAVLIYVAGWAFLRSSGHRILGRYAAFDIVLGIILGSVLSSAVSGPAPFLPTLVATATLVVVQRALTALAARSHLAGRILKGDPNALVLRGQVQRDALRAQSLSLHDLEEAFRLAGHNPSWDDVEEAWLERNGRISVLGRGPSAELRGTDRHEPSA